MLAGTWERSYHAIETWIPERRWGKGSVFFLICAQACLFYRCPGILPRRKISKSSMPIMNKHSTYLKEWNLFSVVNTSMTKMFWSNRSNYLSSPKLMSWGKGPPHSPPAFLSLHQFLSVHQGSQGVYQRDIWVQTELTACATLGMSVNLSVASI